MQRQNAMPDAITMDSLLLACSMPGQLERALAVFAESVARALELSMYSHSILLMEYEQRGVVHVICLAAPARRADRAIVGLMDDVGDWRTERYGSGRRSFPLSKEAEKLKGWKFVENSVKIR